MAQQSAQVLREGGSPTKPEYAGPYRLTDTLGKGGLATVKVGLDFANGKRVAVKIIDKEKLANPREQVSMTREITIMKLLKHKNILRLYDIYENEEKIFLILDIYEGGDLYGHLTQKGAMPPDEALSLFKQIISGVEYCHKSMIVHRDLKPENLLLSSDKKKLVISDFGLSTGMQGSRSLLKTRCGTVHYISPEVAKGDPYVGMASDIWSCGIILYAMVTATLPFEGPSSVAVLKKIVRGEYNMPPTLPRELQDLIRLMLTPDPKERITIPQIKQHPWLLGLPEDTPRVVAEEPPPTPYILTLDDVQQNSDVLSNLKLLGWEESELMNELLGQEMTMAKIFYRLLMEHKNVPMEEQDESPQEVEVSKFEKKMRRRSVGAPTRTSKLADNPTPTKVNPEVRRLRPEKRASQRVNVRRSEKPVTRHNNNSTKSAQSREVTVGSDDEIDVEVQVRAQKSTKEQQQQQRSSETRSDKSESADTSTTTTTTTITTTTTQQQQQRPSELARSESADTSTTTATTTVTTTTTTTTTTQLQQQPQQGTASPANKQVVWGISPTLAPDAKTFQVGSTKNVTQLLESLRHCFADLGQYDLSTKQTRNGIKVKARKSGKRHGGAVVTVNLHQKDDGETELIMKRGEGGKSKEQFKELAKKVEETLVV